MQVGCFEFTGEIFGMKKRFPLGAQVTIERLITDPVSVYNELREKEPITWIDDLKMYFVTGYDDVVGVLQDSESFVAGTEKSTIYDTFGLNILTSEGAKHDRYRKRVRRPFMPKYIRENISEHILSHVDHLIDGFEKDGQVEFREAFARRLPVMTVLSLYGIDQSEEADFRRWYDSFEAALANLTWVEDVRVAASQNIKKVLLRLQEYVDRYRESPDESSFISNLVNRDDGDDPLNDEEIVRNLAMIAFGGISTVEALLLNAFYCLSSDPETFQRVRSDHSLISITLEEVIRYIGPVQSAHRYVAKNTGLLGVDLKKGDVVNCLLIAANHDPRMFSDPHLFNIDRKNIRRHVGFATGVHNCLGLHLARAEARIALERLFTRLPNCRMDPEKPSLPEGYEFRSPSSMNLIWECD